MWIVEYIRVSQACCIHTFSIKRLECTTCNRTCELIETRHNALTEEARKFNSAAHWWYAPERQLAPAPPLKFGKKSNPANAHERLVTAGLICQHSHVAARGMRLDFMHHILYPHFLRPWPSLKSYGKTRFGSKVKQGILLFDALPILRFRRHLVRYILLAARQDIWAKTR